MTVRVRSETDLIVPASVQRRAGIRPGDLVEFKVSARTITIQATPQRTYKPTKAELAAIRKGEIAIARGQCVSLAEFLNELDGNGRKTRPKSRRKVSRWAQN